MRLPPDVECLREARILLWRPRGILSKAEVDKIVGFLTEQENRFGEEFNRFTDLTLIDAVDLTFDCVFHVALHRRLARLGRKPVKSAFLVRTPGVARYVKVHALVTDRSPLKVEMFKGYELAAQWLGVPVELLMPKE